MPTARVQVKEQPKPFVFDEPTEEEIQVLEAEQVPTSVIIIPLSRALPVFACKDRACAPAGSFAAGTELFVDMATVRRTDQWIAVPWPNPRTGPGKRFVALADLEAAYRGGPPAPRKKISAPAFAFALSDPLPINPQTLVGIVCEFKREGERDERRVTRGSGAIITDDGYVITARSVIDISYLNEGLADFHLLNCLVGQMPSSQPLPGIDEIKKVNAFVRLPFLAYTAEPAYIPDHAGLSAYENAWLDFGLLKVNGVNPDARYFGGPTELPDAFPVAPLLISDMPKVGDTTLNFAFPSGTTIGTNADIRTLFLQGLISSVTGYWAGDRRYANDLFLIETHLDTEDTAGGRFGSPIFWKGYIVGIHTAKQQESLEVYNVSAKAVLENLFDNQIAIPLRVY